MRNAPLANTCHNSNIAVATSASSRGASIRGIRVSYMCGGCEPWIRSARTMHTGRANTPAKERFHNHARNWNREHSLCIHRKCWQPSELALAERSCPCHMVYSTHPSHIFHTRHERSAATRRVRIEEWRAAIDAGDSEPSPRETNSYDCVPLEECVLMYKIVHSRNSSHFLHRKQPAKRERAPQARGREGQRKCPLQHLRWGDEVQPRPQPRP